MVNVIKRALHSAAFLTSECCFFSGVYPGSDDEVSSVSLPVGGTDGHQAGGPVAVVGRVGHPALHAVSPD